MSAWSNEEKVWRLGRKVETKIDGDEKWEGRMGEAPTLPRGSGENEMEEKREEKRREKRTKERRTKRRRRRKMRGKRRRKIQTKPADP
jgi:hypothetical protein